MRSLEVVLPPPRKGVFHTVATDRFYTSVQLAFELLHRGVYSVGTIMANRLGYAQAPTEKHRGPAQKRATWHHTAGGG
ncbi:hypothetical protein PI126_g21576 [Phytophthora idaei]|nr:hypothetical protein PI126_g21576 [Phytophthora idaei]